MLGIAVLDPVAVKLLGPFHKKPAAIGLVVTLMLAVPN
jgi:hypothetical protein